MKKIARAKEELFRREEDLQEERKNPEQQNDQSITGILKNQSFHEIEEKVRQDQINCRRNALTGTATRVFPEEEDKLEHLEAGPFVT